LDDFLKGFLAKLGQIFNGSLLVFYILLWMISTLAPMKNLKTFFPTSYYSVESPLFGLPSLTIHPIWVIRFPCGKVTS
jgi:hypothetical protein